MEQNSKNNLPQWSGGTENVAKGLALANLALQDVREFLTVARSLNPKDCLPALNPDTPQLSKLRKENKGVTILALERILDCYASALGSKLNLDFIILEIAESLCEKYYMLSLEEICIVLHKGVRGDYKPESQIAPISFAIDVVLSWFDAYINQERNPYLLPKINQKKEEPPQIFESMEELKEFYEAGKHNAKLLEKIEREREQERAKREGKEADYATFKANFYRKMQGGAE